jgi:chemotaxis protein methyltransferase CheR
MMPLATLPRPLLSQLSELLAARMGLHFPTRCWGDLARGVAAAASSFGMPDADSCARWLLSTALTRGQIETLANHLTVGETYFFRDECSFEALEHHVLPPLMRECEQANRPLRIWSAGCCTGEEPYSIAMLLDRLTAPSKAWNAHILATDINPTFLRKAAEGTYAEWSFRATPAWVRERYFVQGWKSRFEMQRAIRDRVAFAYLNLADDVYPSPTNGTSEIDVIFCRNVLMYFTPQQAEKIVENFRRSLVSGGWLVVSPAETSNNLFSRFSAVGFSGATFYRKLPNTRLQDAATTFPAIASCQEPDAWPLEGLVRDVAPAATRRDMPLRKECGSTPSGWEADDRAAHLHANQGRLVEAAEYCERAVAADKLNPARLYFLAAIRREQGQNDLAAQSLTRALYLDPRFVLAHFALGNICLAQSSRGEAERHFRNTLDLLHGHSSDEALPESEGLSAGRLVEIVTSVLSGLSST